MVRSQPIVQNPVVADHVVHVIADSNMVGAGCALWVVVSGHRASVPRGPACQYSKPCIMAGADKQAACPVDSRIGKQALRGLHMCTIRQASYPGIEIASDESVASP